MAILLTTAATIGLLWMESGPKEVMFLLAVVSIVGLSFGNFSSSWLLVIATIPVFHLITGLFDQPKITGMRLLLGALMLPALIDGPMRRGVLQAAKTSTATWFAIFVAANVVAAIVSGEIEAILRSAVYLEPLVFFLLTFAIVRSQKATLSDVIGAISVGGLIVAALAIVEIWEQRSILEILAIPPPPEEADTIAVYFADNRFGLGGRIVSTIGQPVYAGVYFGVWAFCCGLHAVSRSGPAKLFWATTAGMGVVLLIATGSRGPLIAFALAMAMLVVFTRSRQRSIAAAGVMVSAAVLTVLARFNNIAAYVAETLTFDPMSSEASGLVGRVDLTTTLLEIFQANPLFGVGPGLIQKAGFLGDTDFVALRGLENQYAVILADAGIFAGVAYAIHMIMVFREIDASEVELFSSWHRHAQATMLALFGFYFVCVTSVTCLAVVPNYLLMALCGAFLAQTRSTSLLRQPAPPPSRLLWIGAPR